LREKILKNWHAIVLCAVAVVAGGALLAPPLFWLTQHLGFDFPFRRVYDRALLVCALAGMWPLLRALQIPWKSLGFSQPPRRIFADFLSGWAFGAATLLVVSLILDAQNAPTAAKIAKGFAVGCVVALIEETFFRGFLLSALAKELKFLGALLVTSAIYSIVHFVRPPHTTRPAAEINWWTGLAQLPDFFAASGSVETIFVGFVTLFLAGALLGVSFYKTQSLYLPIGIHAGWVFIIKAVGGRGVVSSAWAWLVLGAGGVWLILWLNRRGKRQ
jgi:membrane protease YdiL (CAAX protease family)